jgi:translation initiation factor IF-3
MAPPEKRPRRNQEIRASKVRLIDAEGNQMGIVWLREALESADESGMDLIEVAPNADPPVCRIMDWGKFRYEAKQRERDQRRKQKNIEVKGLRLRPSTDEHDFMVTRNKAERFLREGHKVRVEVRFRGREITHRDLGQDILLRLAESVSEVSEIETRPSMEGRKMFLVLAPNPETVGTQMEDDGEDLELHDAELEVDDDDEDLELHDAELEVDDDDDDLEDVEGAEAVAEAVADDTEPVEDVADDEPVAAAADDADDDDEVAADEAEAAEEA